METNIFLIKKDKWFVNIINISFYEKYLTITQLKFLKITLVILRSASNTAQKLKFSGKEFFSHIY